ncbi:hypothetical protein PTI98_004519 [Pleurotus ostreatus]|nr:hypothetical protein PTI98_004519 [Pleurotus ostreatus]
MVVFGMIIAEFIMVVRVWALWGSSKIIGAILMVFSIVAIVVSVVYFITFTGTLKFIATDTIAPGLIGCLPGPGTNIVFIDFVVLMAYEASLLILLLLKGVQHRRHVTNHFMYAFYRDGIVYYGVLLLVSTLNVAFLFTGSPENTNLLTTLQRTFHSILSARMLLQLRKSALKRQFFSETSVVVDTPFSTLMFVDGPGPTTNTRRRNTEIATWFGDDGRDRS